MAKDLLLTLLPSASTLVSRAAAEGLALLATLGVSEDAHFMQSTVLHSLDELMQGNKPDGKPRTIALEPISASRSGALLTLASIQRTAQRTTERQLTKARERARSYGDDEVITAKEEELPLLQMITRLIPSLAFHGLFRDYFIVRTHALHSLALLLSYSNRLDPMHPDEVDMQLLRKSIELVEGNYGAAWTSATGDFDRGQEAEKMSSEVGLVAVLLRLMTLLVSHLRHMLVEHPDIGRRFSVMVTVALEIHSSHPVVFVEAMAFFEALASHHEVMPPLLSFASAVDNPLCSCVKFSSQCLVRPARFASGYNGGDAIALVSSRSMRAAAQAAKALTFGGLHATFVSDMLLVPALLSFLEAACASRVCVGATALRSLAASEDIELLFLDGMALEKDIVDVVRMLLNLECNFLRNYDDMLLRWLLFSRVVVTGGSPGRSGVPFDSEQAFTRAGVVEFASLRAAQDAELLLRICGTPRWQVKTLAAQLAADSLDSLSRHSHHADPNSDPNLDFRTAAGELSRLCRAAQQSKRIPPSSKVVFHLEELISSACMSSVATLDHSELRALQGSSLRFLDRLIAAFGNVKDPEQPEKSILDQFSTQLFSSIKHALSAPDEGDGLDALRLFSVGCDTLVTVLSVELTSDTTTLKRLLRPAMATAEECSYFEPGDQARVLGALDSENSLVDSRSSTLVHICKVATTATIFTRFQSASIGTTLSKIRGDLLPQEKGLAVHAAAIAVDGARFLLGNRLSLGGRRLLDKGGRRISAPKSGYLHSNLDDVSELVKGLLIRSWSTCACYSTGPLLNADSRGSSDGDAHDEAKRQDESLKWLAIVVPLLLAGIVDAVEILRERDLDDDGLSSQWADCVLDPSAIAIDCVRGLTMVLVANPSFLLERWQDQIDLVLDCTRKSVFIPALIDSEFGEPDVAFTKEACSFVKAMALACKPAGVLGFDSAILLCLLEPLNVLQQRLVDFEKKPVASSVVSTCMEVIGVLIGKAVVSDSIVLAMVRLVLNLLLEKPQDSFLEASQGLLVCCLRHTSVSSRTFGIARRLAVESNWTAWSAVVLAMESGSVVSASADSVLEALYGKDTARASGALAAIVAVAPKAKPAVAAAISSSLGGGVIEVLLRYGTTRFDTTTLAHRRSICADSIKFLLLAYQQLLVKSGGEEGNTPGEDDIASYLGLLFECFMLLLRFNGLPNHPPPPNSGGDSSLGRMAAQAIVTTARTSPAPFKACVARLSDPDRALVEFAVRGEMSGYSALSSHGFTAPGEEPVKKTLNAASFKR